jgi:uncharacterized protein (DUF885 family)
MKLAPWVLCLALPLATRAADANVDQFLQSFTDQWMRFHTDSAATARYFSGAEQRTMERTIASESLARRDAERKLIRKGFAALKAFDRSKITDMQRLSADIVAWDLQLRIDGEAFQEYSFPLVQTDGAQAALPGLMTVSHPMNTMDDAENYVARLRVIAPRMEETIVEARRLIAKDLVPPKFILQAAIAQIDGFLADAPAKNPLVTTFAEKASRIEGLSAARRSAMQAQVEQITAREVYPAWRKARALLVAELPKASNDAGLWRLRNGVEAYNHALRRFTTTKLKADEIHAIGLRMLADIEGRMDAVLKQLGYTNGTVRERMAKMRADQPTFPATAEGRAKYGAEIAAVIADAQKRAVNLFERVPKGSVIARPYPEFMGARAQSYSRGAPDGSRPGTYQYPVYGVTMTRFGMKTVAYHEAIPGHHFQITLQMEDTTLPKWRQLGIFGNNSANGEGWGLYAERLVAEEGWYEGDPVGLLGQLDAAAFRARRLVVDTGMHALKWSRAQAVEFLGPNPVGSAETEIDRYVMRPGQACSYMIGELKIVELRDRAKQQLGGKFSLREFHNVILGMGRVPLEIMDQELDRWIARKKG